MKIRPFFILVILLLAAAGGYAVGRFQVNRPASDSAFPDRGAAVASSMLANRPEVFRRGEGEPLPTLSEDLGGQEIIDTLIAAQAAVSAENMSLAIRKAAEEPDPVRSNLMFAQLIQMLNPENAEAALEAFSKLANSSQVDSNRRLFRFAWGQIDGPAAAANVRKITGRNARYAAYSVMSGWSSVEPDAAIAWVESIDGEKVREPYYRGIVGGLAKTDPGLATSFALERHAAGDREADDYISTIAREQFRNGIESTTAWIDTLTVTELKQDAVYRVARELVQQEPAEAGAWVERYIGNEFAVSAIREVADEWAEEDGASAVAWVAGLPPGKAKTGAFGQAFSEWTEDDPFAAASYLVTMPHGADRDAGVQAMARRHVREDPEAAVTWAASITDESIRDSTVAYTGQQWMRREPEKAKAWLETSGLPDELRQKVENGSRNAQQFNVRFRDGEMRGFSGGGGSGGTIQLRSGQVEVGGLIREER